MGSPSKDFLNEGKTTPLVLQPSITFGIVDLVLQDHNVIKIKQESMDSPIVKTPNNSSSNDMTLIFYLFR